MSQIKSLVFSIFLLISFYIPLTYSQQEELYEDIGSIFDKIITDDNFFKTYNFKNIIFYDEDSIESGIKNNQPLLLYVYASYHHYSQKYVPEFLSVAEHFEKNKSKYNFTMNFGRINGADNRRFSMTHNLRQYPKIVLFYKRKEYIFNGDYYKNDILRFISRIIYGNIYKVNTIKEVNELLENKELNEKIFLLSTIRDTSNNENIIKTFEEYGEKNGKINYIYCSSNECLDKYEKEDIFIIKNFDEKINSYSSIIKEEKINDINIDKLEKFVIIYGLEAGSLLDNKDYFSLAEIHRKKILIYYRDSKNNEQTKFDKVIKEVGIELRNKNIFTFISDVDGNEYFAETAENFIIAQHELPTLILQDLKKEKNLNDKRIIFYNEEEEIKPDTYRLTKFDTDEYNKEKVLEFVNDINEGKIKRDLVSQFPPNDEFVGINYSYKIIVGRNFDKEVLDKKNNVLFTLVNRKTGCDLCKNYLKVIRDLAKNNENKNLDFIVMDGSSNEARDLTYKIEDLPLIYLFVNNKENEKKVVKFEKENKNENINEKEIENFLKDNIEGYIINRNRGDL